MNVTTEIIRTVKKQVLISSEEELRLILNKHFGFGPKSKIVWDSSEIELTEETVERSEE